MKLSDRRQAVRDQGGHVMHGMTTYGEYGVSDYR